MTNRAASLLWLAVLFLAAASAQAQVRYFDVPRGSGPHDVAAAPSANGPVGFGVANVASASHRSCQRSSISWASAPVYRNLGASSGVVGGEVIGH